MRLLFVVVAVIAVSCGGPSKKSAESESANVSTEVQADLKVDTLVLAVEGMTCTGCEQTVQSSIESLSGVKSVKASFEEKTAVVEFYEGQLDKEKVAEAVVNAGYEVVTEDKTE